MVNQAKDVAMTLAAIAKLTPPCGGLERARLLLPARRKITVAMARDAGVPINDVLWVVAHLAVSVDGVRRRFVSTLADFAAHVLHIYEVRQKTEAPHRTIQAIRDYRDGKIGLESLQQAYNAYAYAYVTAYDAASTASAAANAGRAVRAYVTLSYAHAIYTYASSVYTTSAAPSADERDWQYDRLANWFSADEPEDWPLAGFQEAA